MADFCSKQALEVLNMLENIYFKTLGMLTHKWKRCIPSVPSDT